MTVHFSTIALQSLVSTDTVIVLLQEARADADAKLDEVMAALGFEGWREVAT